MLSFSQTVPNPSGGSIKGLVDMSMIIFTALLAYVSVRYLQARSTMHSDQSVNITWLDAGIGFIFLLYFIAPLIFGIMSWLFRMALWTIFILMIVYFVRDYWLSSRNLPARPPLWHD